jgi:hypothetical protein
MCTFAAITAIVLYQFILQPRHKNDITKTINNNSTINKDQDKLKNDNNNNNHQNNNGSSSHSPKPATFIQLRDIVLVYGIILPIWVILPSLVLYYLDLRNFLFKFVIGVVSPTLCLFRTTEGTTPTKQTNKTFVHRYTTSTTTTTTTTRYKFIRGISGILVLLLLYQIVYHYYYSHVFLFFCRAPLCLLVAPPCFLPKTISILIPLSPSHTKPCMDFVPTMLPNHYRTMCYTLPLP